ncbi:hypothetical protein GVAV_001585 [Gurleya vavrai]
MKKTNPYLENNNYEVLLQNKANFLSQGDNTNANNSTNLVPGFLRNDNKEKIKLNNFDYNNVEKQFFNQVRDTYFNHRINDINKFSNFENDGQNE